MRGILSLDACAMYKSFSHPRKTDRKGTKPLIQLFNFSALVALWLHYLPKLATIRS